MLNRDIRPQMKVIYAETLRISQQRFIGEEFTVTARHWDAGGGVWDYDLRNEWGDELAHVSAWQLQPTSQPDVKEDG